MKALLILLLLSLTSCTELGLFALNTYANLDGQRIKRDISYGERSYQKLNVYQPPESIQSKGVLVFFYGGGWSSGSKDDYDFIAEAFTSNGFVTVIPDYAKYPEFKYPTAVEDGAKAVRWVSENQSALGLSKPPMFIAGHSAGGHLAAMLCTNRSFLEQESVSRGLILGLIGIAGPYDFRPYEPQYVDYFSPAAPEVSKAMPATYVDGSQPPMLLVHGLEDEVVGEVNFESMKRQVERHGGELTLDLREGLDHVGILTALSSLLSSERPVLQEMLSFLKQHSTKQPSSVN